MLLWSVHTLAKNAEAAAGNSKRNVSSFVLVLMSFMENVVVNCFQCWPVSSKWSSALSNCISLKWMHFGRCQPFWNRKVSFEVLTKDWYVLLRHRLRLISTDQGMDCFWFEGKPIFNLEIKEESKETGGAKSGWNERFQLFPNFWEFTFLDTC